MTARTDKRTILEAAIRQHESVIADFREGIRQMMATEGNVNEEEHDLQTLAMTAETSADVDRLAGQLSFANRELEQLIRMRQDIDQLHQAIQRGSVVVTDRDTFFVSASIERFYVEDHPFFGLSTETPLFQKMKGLKSGMTFSYGKTTYQILDVY
ncbi:MAG: hypothetical protein JNN04_11260 [Cyclobacteriaceae bacterium]|nr:hypothetical protein [Cyclobacteriaceae bacterium]